MPENTFKNFCEQLPADNESERKAIEQTSADLLQTAELISSEEQERLVSNISDPELSVFVLTSSSETGRVLSSEQKEKLLQQIMTDDLQALSMYLNFSLARNIGAPLYDAEIEWLKRLEAVLLQTEDPDVAVHLLEHAASATDADRERLQKIMSEKSD